MPRILGSANTVGINEDRGRYGYPDPRGGRGGRGAHGEPHEMPLAAVPAGETVIVARILGDEVFRAKMMAIGLIPGIPVSVLKSGSRQPLLLALTASRFMLDCRSSELVTVRTGRALRNSGGTWGGGRA